MSVCFLYKSDDSSLSARKMWRGWTFSNWQMCFKFYCPCSLQDPSIMQKQNDLWWHVICAESTHPDGRQFWSLKHALRMAVDRCDGRMHWCWMWQEENSICSSSAAIIIGMVAEDCGRALKRATPRVFSQTCTQEDCGLLLDWTHALQSREVHYGLITGSTCAHHVCSCPHPNIRQCLIRPPHCSW